MYEKDTTNMAINNLKQGLFKHKNHFSYAKKDAINKMEMYQKCNVSCVTGQDFVFFYGKQTTE